jgi:hypothetical protein
VTLHAGDKELNERKIYEYFLSTSMGDETDFITIAGQRELSMCVEDLGIDLSVVLDASQNQGVVVSSIINQVSTYFNPATRQLGQNVNVSELNRILQSQNGVISVTSLQIFNKVGGQYSSSQTSMSYIDSTTKEIGVVDGTIFAMPNQIYQIRFANKDIRVKVKNLQSVSIS